MSTTIHFNQGGGDDDIVVRTPYADLLHRLSVALIEEARVFEAETSRGRSIAVPVASVLYLEER